MAYEFSLIIPTFNRYEYLQKCFRYLEKVRFPKNAFEAVVIDDGSQDGTSTLESSSASFNLRVIHKSNGGTSSARNTGIMEAKGLFCFFMDDDCLVHEDLFLEHQKAHLAQSRLLVRGPVINIPNYPAPEKLPKDLYKHFSMNYLCTSNASLYKDHLLEAGLFDTNFPRWEDAELAVRLKRIGVIRKFVLDAVVFHLKPPVSLESLVNTAKKDGEAAALLYMRYPSLAMRIRSGLHPLNTLRNKLFTEGLLKQITEQSVNGLGPLPKKTAESLLIEKAYLDAGNRKLRELRKS